MAGASPAATFSKAVDLVSCQKDGLFGHMTIGRGLVEAIRPHIDVAGSRVLLVGAGPAARAIALELALAQVQEIFIANRSARMPHHFSTISENFRASFRRLLNGDLTSKCPPAFILL